MTAGVSTMSGVRNLKASAAVVLALVSVGVLVVAGARTRLDGEVTMLSFAAIPVSLLSAISALSLARRARFDYQRTLGRSGGGGTAAFGRTIGLLGLLLGLTAALAVGVWIVLRAVR